MEIPVEGTLFPDGISERLKKLLVAIHDEAEQLLSTHAVYDVLSYGWSNEDTPNPEYVGHAMWQVNPPFEHDWEALQNDGTVTYAPTKRDEIFLLNGEDFVGTMLFARRSLGMALCYAAVANSENLSFENLEFWHEYATTLQWLNIASDRLRNFFLMARFGQTEEEYKESYKKKNNDKNTRIPYAAPFNEPLEGASDNMREVLSKLSSIATELQIQRKVRNGIVHKVATKGAGASIKILRDQREFAQSGKTIQFPTPKFEESQKAGIASPNDETVASAVQNMKFWYTYLVKASSLVFEFEYFKRKQTG